MLSAHPTVASRVIASLAAAILAAWLPAIAAAEPAAAPPIRSEPPAADAAAIRAAASAYREAVVKGDVAASRQMWTVDGDVVDGWGNVLSAAEAVAATGGTAAERPEVRVGDTRLRSITPDVVLEDGAVDVVLPGTATPLEGWFSAIWVKQGGQWKLAGIRESERPTTLHGDSLDDLEWMVGEWTLVPDDDAATDAMPAMEMSVRWDAGHMFLLRDVRMTSPAATAEPVTIDVQQRIGWDPLVGRIRSWSFATDGTRGEATWFRDGTSWITKGTTILADGTQSTTVHISSYDGHDRCVWRTIREPFAADDRMPVRATWVRTPKEGVK
jgi:ketosteroid isomerase-like protein